MLANYLIGLREGLEASLVVSILVAYLVKTGRRGMLGRIWVGVGAAITLALGVGALLTFGTKTLTFQAQEAIGGVLSIVAVALVTWMVFWMAAHARGLRNELHGQVDSALDRGGWALAVVAFLAVAREGLETALFVWSAVRASGEGSGALLGAGLGIATAILLAWLIYRGALRLNLGTFFTWTGAALIVVAAGVLAYGVHDLQEAGILPGLDTLAFDVSGAIPPGSWYGTVLKGTLNFSPATTTLEAFVWVAYLVPVMWLYLRKVRARPAPRPADAALPPASPTAAEVAAPAPEAS